MSIKFRLPGLFQLGKDIQEPRKMRLGFKLLLKTPLRFATMPIIRKYHPWTRADKTNVYWLPINKSLERPENVALPYDVLHELIDRSSYRVIMNWCGCRKTYECKHYPVEIGCLAMGEEAKLIHPQQGKPASKEQSHEHILKAEAAGLPAIIGKARVDNFVYGVPDTGKLLSVCFCCDCCCFIKGFSPLPSDERKKIMHRLDGLRVWVDNEQCVGCGNCAKHCFLNLIQLIDGKAFIPDDCMGCGRCVHHCKQNAIHICLDNPEFKERTIRSIENSVKF